MNKECQGCYLIKVAYPSDPCTITCQVEDLDCPCKTCLVKITCDLLERSSSCEPFQTFHNWLFDLRAKIEIKEE